MSVFLAEPGLKKGKGKKLLKNARIFDPESGYDQIGNLLIDGDKITDFGKIEASDAEIIDCEGKLLTPGLIDIQVHAREPGFEKKENLESVSRSAAAGGVTGIAVMPNTQPVTDNVATVEFIQRRAIKKSIVNVHIYASITKNMEGKELSEIGMLKEAGVVGFTDDGLPLANPFVMRNALTYATEFDALIAQHAEDLQLSNGGCINEGIVSSRLGVPGIPNASEAVMV
ncbi:MAG: dihydroorotase, partial [Alphaproteobacteria bacterium CG11_big_fil_rev_8_21_14_0_20_44_7]